ncbi:hypothetical protein, partial [Nitratireductor indicus]|uniref:hypothetical protein n=1 Tax=Nitratireductor indicus TaxID=721133 RepID=UPI001AEC52AE
MGSNPILSAIPLASQNQQQTSPVFFAAVLRCRVDSYFSHLKTTQYVDATSRECPFPGFAVMILTGGQNMK